MSYPAIRVEHLGKRYTIGHKGRVTNYVALRDVLSHAILTLWERTRALFTGKPIIAGDQLEEVWALKDVSFEIQPGEAIGIIGHNGAGKSTLLKVLSRITEPTTGRVMIRGTVGSLLEIGTGFHPELTGRENIYLSGTILGMQRREIDRKFDEIVAFAEVEKFLDTPAKRYSSGMYVRLAFAVAAHLEPDILIVDEVLAVGDLSFQKKCLGKMGEVSQKGGRTVLFVSHNMGAISQLCTRSIWIQQGEIRYIGPTAEVISKYLQSIDYQVSKPVAEFPIDPEMDAQLHSVKLVNQEGLATTRFSCDEPITLEMQFEIRRPLAGLFGELEIARADGTRVMVSDSFDSAPNPMDELPVGFYLLKATIPQRTLGVGDYTVHLGFASLFVDEFNIHYPGVVIGFSLTDLSSQLGNDRRGYFSTLLNWQAEPLAAPQLKSR